MRKTATTIARSLKCAGNIDIERILKMTNNTISETELLDNLENGAVKELVLSQSEDDKFKVYVVLTWKEGRQLLETQRRTPRLWASLDRLVRHMNQKYKHEKVPIIRLELRNSHEHGNQQFGRSKDTGK